MMMSQAYWRGKMFLGQTHTHEKKEEAFGYVFGHNEILFSILAFWDTLKFEAFVVFDLIEVCS